jgi:hypothetical protein
MESSNEKILMYCRVIHKKQKEIQESIESIEDTLGDLLDEGDDDEGLGEGEGDNEETEEGRADSE